MNAFPAPPLRYSRRQVPITYDPGFFALELQNLMAAVNRRELGVFHVDDYGADPYATKSSADAFLHAAADAASVPGGILTAGPGKYLVNQINLTGQGTAFVPGAVGTKLIARTPNQVIIKVSASDIRCEGFGFDSNGLSGVCCVAVAPQDETLTSPMSIINFVRLGFLTADSCDEFVRVKAGPGTPLGDSNNFYGVLYRSRATFCKRTVWFQSSPGSQGGASSAGSGPNGWAVHDVRGGQSGANVVVQVDSGDSLHLENVAAEGVQSAGAPNPSGIATGIYIRRYCPVVGTENAYIKVVSPRIEACTRDIFNDSPTTEFYGCFSIASKCFGAFPQGGVWLSGAAMIQAAAPMNRLPNLALQAGATNLPSMNIPSGVAPTTPNEGDIWFVGDTMFRRRAGVTKSVVFT